MKVIVLLAVLMGFISCSVYDVSVSDATTTYDDGQQKTYGSKKYKKAKEMDRYNFYQRWDNTYIEYYPSGDVKSSYESNYKSASYGRPCKEIQMEYVAYNEDGVKVYEQKDICDCRISVIKEYDAGGKLVHKKKTKTKTKNLH